MASMKTSFQGGVNALRDECIACGVTPSENTPTGIIAAIKNIFNNRYNAGVSATKKGNATAGNVLSGKTFTSASAGINISGTMANRGALNWNPSGSESKTVSAGYYSGGTLSTANAYNAGKAAATHKVSLRTYGIEDQYTYSEITINTSNCKTVKLGGLKEPQNWSYFGLTIKRDNSVVFDKNGNVYDEATNNAIRNAANASYDVASNNTLTITLKSLYGYQDATIKDITIS